MFAQNPKFQLKNITVNTEKCLFLGEKGLFLSRPTAGKAVKVPGNTSYASSSGVTGGSGLSLSSAREKGCKPRIKEGYNIRQ